MGVGTTLTALGVLAGVHGGAEAWFLLGGVGALLLGVSVAFGGD